MAIYSGISKTKIVVLTLGILFLGIPFLYS